MVMRTYRIEIQNIETLERELYFIEAKNVLEAYSQIIKNGYKLFWMMELYKGNKCSST